LSPVPEFGRIPAGSTGAFDIAAFDNSIHEALEATGIRPYKLGLDISLNQSSRLKSPAFWQLQLWGFFQEPKTLWREQLKALVNPNGTVTRPIKVVKPASLEAAAAYGLKGTFVRRVSYRKAKLDRDDRGACWNTRDRPLRGDAWVELMIFLDRIGLQRRVLVSDKAPSLSAAPQWGHVSARSASMSLDGLSLRQIGWMGMVDHPVNSDIDETCVSRTCNAAQRYGSKLDDRATLVLHVSNVSINAAFAFVILRFIATTMTPNNPLAMTEP
jgi:hypothetical protein